MPSTIFSSNLFWDIDLADLDMEKYAPYIVERVLYRGQEEGIKLANLKDITAMKLEAITNRGTRRDFVDIYFLLQIKLSIKLAVAKY